MHHRSLFDLAAAAIGLTPTEPQPPALATDSVRADNDEDWLSDPWHITTEAQFGDG